MIRRKRHAGEIAHAELQLGDGLPTVEIALPLEHAVRKGDLLQVKLASVRLFAA